MLYLKKLGLVLTLTIMCVLWLPLLASRSLLAIFVWLGRKTWQGLQSKDSGVKIACCLGILGIGPPWLLCAGVMIALASYEIMCFSLMTALFRAEDIGYRASAKSADKPDGPLPERGERNARVLQLPQSDQLTMPQALSASKAKGWNPEAARYSWSNQHQCWFNDEEALHIDGSRVGWVKDGRIVA